MFSLISLASSAAFCVALFVMSSTGFETVSRALWNPDVMADEALLAMLLTEDFKEAHDFPSSSTFEGADPASFHRRQLNFGFWYH